LNSSQKTTALKESLTVATTPGMLPIPPHYRHKENQRQVYYEEISELERKITLKKETQKTNAHRKSKKVLLAPIITTMNY
jgi:hypothetical protein